MNYFIYLFISLDGHEPFTYFFKPVIQYESFFSQPHSLNVVLNKREISLNNSFSHLLCKDAYNGFSYNQDIFEQCYYLNHWYPFIENYLIHAYNRYYPISNLFSNIDLSIKP